MPMLSLISTPHKRTYSSNKDSLKIVSAPVWCGVVDEIVMKTRARLHANVVGPDIGSMTPQAFHDRRRANFCPLRMLTL